MNVIPFPSAKTKPHGGGTLSDAALFYVIACLRVLGEPATASEIRELLDEVGCVAPPTDVMAMLAAYSEDGERLDEHPALFRRVSLAGVEAWAFTQTFREMLHREGLTPNLRNRC